MSNANQAMINQQLDALLAHESNPVSNLANASALLMQLVPDLNWAGFYLADEAGENLDLGPFQGKVACMHIKGGDGVCGTALRTQSVQLVENVHEFPGHIACDSDSNAELVIPLTKGAKRIGVMDLDSPTIDRFTDQDVIDLTEFSEILLKHLDF
ncbi:GAF domain-containing protein [Levilactobacillus bambusae]|uniref:Histidine kinase n=1 Tax=Levilactobacillus bambusae TaxID=2024736 RepID=A0A2V1MWV2_9LACO|nr:GAF domain-containing protein [Levilactobacillus bambusae]PWF99553.1 histidine kinase [Levilactobacillus bambusae]